MNSKALKVLEYNKIIDKLVTFATSSLGKELCQNLRPMTNYDEILMAQRETADALIRVYKHGSISFAINKDIKSSLMGLEIGRVLGAGELLGISKMLFSCKAAKSYSDHDTSDDSPRDSLDERFNALDPLSRLYKEITACIISEDEISDDASPALKEIRRQIKITNDRIHEHLSSVINSHNSKTMLQDSIITMRNGRYCIPVKSEYKGQFQGMVHDQSASGSTFFIEPMAVVKYNNELSELAGKEQSEIEKILANLSNLAALDKDILHINLQILTELDFIFAKALLAKSMKASKPVFNQDKIIDIKQGRHPLISSKNVVPINIYLGTDFRLLVITGPNTGGKTVSLKTVGLFTLMGQAGLHIPAFDGSKLSVFSEVFADIGDEQSIEQSLSTFSSHMTNTVSIIEQANADCLVLFDELGAGTDPTEGAALARSILNYMNNSGITTLATTHYSEIKLFALETDGVENACCEFDVNTLKPTYKLLIGVPGKSNAFAISSKLGLPDFIIDKARTYINSNEKKFEDVIEDLENTRKALEAERSQLKKDLEDADILLKEYEEQNAILKAKKQKIIDKANAEARDILQEAKDYADETIKQYNKWSSSGSSIKDMENARTKLNKKIKSKNVKADTAPVIKPKKKYSIEDVKIGDQVKVLSMGSEGTVSSLPDSKGNIKVHLGFFESKVNIKDIEFIGSAPKPVQDKSANKYKTNMGMTKTMNMSTEVNVIGMTVDEAIAVVDKYLDDAYLAHLPSVTIIHGRGTGALKNAVAAHLKKTSYVKSFRLGGPGEGNMGATIVDFK